MAQFRCAAAACALSAALSFAAHAAQPPQPPVKPAEPAEASKGLDSITHPGKRLGARLRFIERQFSIIPTLVIVPDEASFVAAIRGWHTSPDLAVRYPILIDDMTWSSRMRIAQFVRAFKPRNIVTWKVGGAEANLPPDPQERKGHIESVAAGVWGATSAAGLKKVWDERGFVPPGVVVCNINDGAWTAGLALAAFHGQPIIWLDPPQHPDPMVTIPLPMADAFNAEIIKAVQGTGWSWNQLGDDIEAVTLCATTPTRVALGQRDVLAYDLGFHTTVPPTTERKYLALTDIIGRAPKPVPKPGPGVPPIDKAKLTPPPRWAWCGQIMGTHARAAFDAMCAAFLQPDRAWLFDGYEANGRWNEYDMTRAAGALEKVGISSILDDGPSGKSEFDFRSRAAGQGKGSKAPSMGIDAGLIAINTKGNADFFDLSMGQCKPVDVPILHRPAMLYLVHSFSAAAPLSRLTLGAMWADRGVYAYLGSVEEPYLQAFVPTPEAMSRIADGIPWGAAVRHDNFEPWKLTVFGDPLITLGPPGPRTTTIALPLQGVEDVAAKLPGQLQTKDYAGALWTLLLTGRDKDAARLLSAVAARDPKQVTTEVALAGVTSAYLEGDTPTFLMAAAKCKPALQDAERVQRNGLWEIRDMAWQAIWPHAGAPSREEADLLAEMIRPENEARDLLELRRMLDRVPR